MKIYDVHIFENILCKKIALFKRLLASVPLVVSVFYCCFATHLKMSHLYYGGPNWVRWKPTTISKPCYQTFPRATWGEVSISFTLFCKTFTAKSNALPAAVWVWRISFKICVTRSCRGLEAQWKRDFNYSGRGEGRGFYVYAKRRCCRKLALISHFPCPSYVKKQKQASWPKFLFESPRYSVSNQRHL